MKPIEAREFGLFSLLFDSECDGYVPLRPNFLHVLTRFHRPLIHLHRVPYVLIVWCLNKRFDKLTFTYEGTR
jgi:hypothetical protein